MVFASGSILTISGVQYPYVGISTLSQREKKSRRYASAVRTLTDAIQIFKSNKERSLAGDEALPGGASDEMLEENLRYFSKRMPKYPYPSVEAIKTALK